MIRLKLPCVSGADYLGDMAAADDKPKDAFDWYLKAADGGLPQAMVKIGKAAMSGPDDHSGRVAHGDGPDQLTSTVTAVGLVRMS